MKILVLNGPSLNLLGIREPDIYGKNTYEDLCNMIKKYCLDNNIEVEIYQSNHEGDLVDKIQEAYFKKVDGIVINPAAYTHTSIALLDALEAVKIRTIEVHISDIKQREDFRKISFIRDYCEDCIVGKGFNGYIEAINKLINK